MTQAPKIIHSCNHLIISNTRKYGDIQMIRSANIYDIIPKNIKINRIDSIRLSDDKIYKRGYHYSQSISKDIIEWMNLSEVPRTGEAYTISAAYVYTSSNKYTIDDCPRCNGNGWYSSITDSQGQMSFVSGAQKLVQEFIKLINTESSDTTNSDNGSSDESSDGNDYGTDIRKVLGENVYSEVDINNKISASISRCEEYLKRKQNDELANGVQLEDSEILDHIEVKQIYFVRDQCAYVVSIILYNREQKAMRFNFKI